MRADNQLSSSIFKRASLHRVIVQFSISAVRVAYGTGNQDSEQGTVATPLNMFEVLSGIISMEWLALGVWTSCERLRHGENRIRYADAS